MARRTERPLDAVVTARMKLEMFAQYGDMALKDQTPQELAAEVLAALNILMEFRNIVNGMAKLEETPAEAARIYIA